MKKYAALEAILREEFESIGNFVRQTNIPKSTLSMLINGKYGSDETEVKKKISEEIKRLRPNVNLARLWDVTNEYHLKHLDDIGTIKKGFKLVVDVQIGETGEKTMTSYVEGY
ncbi:MAG: hypothetical protein ACE144_12490 [Thermodesulfobacteriota bacterium]